MIKRSTIFVSGVLVAAAIGFSIAPGCGGGGGGGTTTTDGGTGGDGGAGYTPTVPPTRTGTAGTGSEKWFAVSQLFLGINARPGSSTKASKAWQDFGFDIDGRNTTADQSAAANTAAGATAGNTCMRLTGSSSNYLVDGPGGLDNNFGQFLVQTIKSLKSDAEDTVNADIAKGGFTLLLHVQNWSATDHDGVSGELFIGNNIDGAATPKFDTTDKWQVNVASFSGAPSGAKSGDAFTGTGKANLQFPKGYIAKGAWVSGDLGAGDIDLQIGISGTTIDLPISAGVVSVNVDGSNGTVAGAINVESLKAKLSPLAGRFGICPDSPNYKTVVDSLTRSADVVTGAPQLQTPGSPCTGISIGIGFIMKETGAPDQVYVSPPPTGGGSCDDAGTSDGGAGDAAASD